MPNAPLPTPKFQFFVGLLTLPGGKAYFHAAVSEEIQGPMLDTEPQATYVDAEGQNRNANPIIFDAAGRAGAGGMSIWLDPALSYNVRVYDADDVLVWAQGNLQACQEDLGTYPTRLLPIEQTPLAALTFYDQNGAALAGGKLFVYLAGTSELADTFSDEAGTPSTVDDDGAIILDEDGHADLFVDCGQSYKFKLYDALDNLVFTVDKIKPCCAEQEFEVELISTFQKVLTPCPPGS